MNGRRITIGASATLRACLRNSRSGCATFASVTSFAKQTRAIVNVGTPWSLDAIAKMQNIEELKFGTEYTYYPIIGPSIKIFYLGNRKFDGTIDLPELYFARSHETLNKYKNFAEVPIETIDWQNDPDYESLNAKLILFIHESSKSGKKRVERNIEILNKYIVTLKSLEERASLFETDAIKIAFDFTLANLGRKGVFFYKTRLLYRFFILIIKIFLKPIRFASLFIFDNFAIGFAKFKEYQIKKENYKDLINETGYSTLYLSRLGGKSKKERIEEAKKNLDEALEAYIEMNKIVIGLTVVIITIGINIALSFTEFFTKKRELTEAMKKIESLTETIESQKRELNNQKLEIEILGRIDKLLSK